MLRQGRLTLSEQAYIKENCTKERPEIIAAHLNRDEKRVRKFILLKCATTPLGQETAETQLELYKISKNFEQTAEFELLTKEFDPLELRYFQHRAVKYLNQFKHDVQTSEEAQIYLLVKLEIFLHRNRVNQLKMKYDITRLKKLCRRIYTKHKSDPTAMTDNERIFVQSMENNIAALQGASQASTNEFLKLEMEHASILKDLKATRTQRLTRIDNSKFTMTELIKQLEEREVQERESRQLEVFKIAIDKEHERLSGPHAYLNNDVDLPLLTHETVVKSKIEEKPIEAKEENKI